MKLLLQLPEKFLIMIWNFATKTSGVQKLQRSNVERPIFRNFKIRNIKITKDELFEYFIYEFIFNHFFKNYLNAESI